MYIITLGYGIYLVVYNIMQCHMFTVTKCIKCILCITILTLYNNYTILYYTQYNCIMYNLYNKVVSDKNKIN